MENAPQAALDGLEAAEALVAAADEGVVYYLGRWVEWDGLLDARPELPCKLWLL